MALAEERTDNKEPETDNKKPDGREKKGGGQKPDGKEKADTENTEKENEKLKDEKISEYGQTMLENSEENYRIHLLSIVGEIEGHENLPSGSKATKYDHVLPQLAQIEDDKKVEGLLVLLNTSGGDVDAGLAIAEMIASLSIPTVSLVLGGSHSIGGPLAVSTDYSFIVPSGAMIIHPVRMSVMGIGAPLTKDLGTILIGEDAVKEGLIDEVGGIRDALARLYEMVDERRRQVGQKRRSVQGSKKKG